METNSISLKGKYLAFMRYHCSSCHWNTCSEIYLWLRNKQCSHSANHKSFKPLSNLRSWAFPDEWIEICVLCFWEITKKDQKFEWKNGSPYVRCPSALYLFLFAHHIFQLLSIFCSTICSVCQSKVVPDSQKCSLTFLVWIRKHNSFKSKSFILIEIISSMVEVECHVAPQPHLGSSCADIVKKALLVLCRAIVWSVYW